VDSLGQVLLKTKLEFLHIIYRLRTVHFDDFAKETKTDRCDICDVQ